MKGDGLVRHYDRFTPNERFHLVLEAMARGDDDEVRRLAATCPLQTYRMGDHRYTEKIEGGRLAVAGFSIAWLHANRAYRLADGALFTHRTARDFAVKGYVAGANATWKAAGKKGLRIAIDGREPRLDDPSEALIGEVRDSLQVELEARYREAVSRLKGVWGAFCQFCEDIGVEPEKLLAWNKAVLLEVEVARELLDGDIPADEETVDTVYEGLCKAWPSGT